MSTRISRRLFCQLHPRRNYSSKQSNTEPSFLRSPTPSNTQSNVGSEVLGSDVKTSPARGWRKYADRFKKAPASHAVSFAVLHELTAIIPLPLIYFGLQATDPPLPAFSETTMVEAERRGKKILGMFGIGGFGTSGTEVAEGKMGEISKRVVHAAVAYAVVKAALPLRLGVCFTLAPWFARVAVIPFTGVVKKIRGYIIR